MTKPSKKSKSHTPRLEPASGMEVKGDMAARICWYHYREGQTQQQIADRIGLSRVTVNKIISESVRRGYINVTINTPLRPCLELEQQLKERYSLQEVIVVPAPTDETQVRTSVGLAAGDYISDRLKPGQTLGLGWGGTIFAAAQSLRQRPPSGNTIVSMSGGLHESTVINPYDNAAMFARILNASCHYLTAPMFVESSELRTQIMESRSIRAVIGIARHIDMTMLTAIDLSPQTWIIKHGALTPELVKSLIAAGSPGGVCDQYLDTSGRVLDHPINKRLVSIPLEIVKKVEHNILAAGGAYKVPVIRAILKAEFIHVLITDERAAMGLLKPN